MDNQSEDSIMITSSIEAEQEIMAVTITTQTIKTPVSRKLKKKKGVFKKDGLNIKEYSSWLQEIKKDASQARSTHTTLNAEVKATNQCRSRRQCTIERTGYSMCEGPDDFIAYSTVDHKSVRKIKRLIRRTSSLRESLNQEHKENGGSSICATLIMPAADCKDRKCVEVYRESL
ncbi:unnamed protein product [Rotaria magnacalcarata]